MTLSVRVVSEFGKKDCKFLGAPSLDCASVFTTCRATVAAYPSQFTGTFHWIPFSPFPSQLPEETPLIFLPESASLGVLQPGLSVPSVILFKVDLQIISISSTCTAESIH